MDDPQVRRTRSWSRANGLIEENEQNSKKDELEDIDKWPVVKFYGTIQYCTSLADITLAADQLLEQVECSSDDEFALGFDMEWPFSFKTGPGKTALIQICTDKRNCVLLHVSELNRLPVALNILLGHDRVKLCGVNIRNDIHKLARDFPHISKEKILNNCVDSRTQAKEVSTGRSWSMEKLVNHFLKMRIDKSKAVRMSQWHVIPLSEVQQMYAATDAYISLVLYKHFKSLLRRKAEQQQLENSLKNCMVLVKKLQ